jgi:hypothetical protein
MQPVSQGEPESAIAGDLNALVQLASQEDADVRRAQSATVETPGLLSGNGSPSDGDHLTSDAGQAIHVFDISAPASDIEIQQHVGAHSSDAMLSSASAVLEQQSADELAGGTAFGDDLRPASSQTSKAITAPQAAEAGSIAVENPLEASLPGDIVLDSQAGRGAAEIGCSRSPVGVSSLADASRQPGATTATISFVGEEPPEAVADMDNHTPLNSFPDHLASSSKDIDNVSSELDANAEVSGILNGSTALDGSMPGDAVETSDLSAGADDGAVARLRGAAGSTVNITTESSNSKMSSGQSADDSYSGCSDAESSGTDNSFEGRNTRASASKDSGSHMSSGSFSSSASPALASQRLSTEGAGEDGPYLQRGLTMSDFLKQRERILLALSKVLHRFRTDFGRQATRNVVKFYEAIASVQSEHFQVMLRSGLDFAAMVAAFCASSPDQEEDEESADRLPDDYLVDVVKSCCGQRLFAGFAREQRATLIADLLPMEQCEQIKLEGVLVIAAAVEQAARGLEVGRHRKAAPFQYWDANHSFTSKVHKATLRSSAHGGLFGSSASRESTCTGHGGTQSATFTEADVTSTSNALTSIARKSTTEAGGAQGETEDVATRSEDHAVTGKSVYLLSTRHIVETWRTYGTLLPLFKGTADVPLIILRAVQALFEEFMLWIVTAFAGIHPDAVIRGLGGTHDRFFQVVRRLMMSSDKRSGGTRFTRLLNHAQRELERSDTRKPGGTGRPPADHLKDRRVVGGSLDRLVRGTIACDALSTLASHLLQLEPLLSEQYYMAGDDAFLRLLAELFERGSGQLFSSPGNAQPERVMGSVHEVESVRKRCVEGATISNLDALRSRVLSELRRTSYAGVGLAAGRPAWLKALLSELQVFVDALMLCTESRKLTNASLLEIWTVAVLHIDQIVLEALSDCVEPAGKFKGMFTSMVNAAKAEERREAKKGLSRDGCMQLSSDVAQLVRGIAQAQPSELHGVEVFRLMSVSKWVEGCYNPFAAAQLTEEAQSKMVDAWMLWAATCHRGTHEGKAQCLSLFTAMQRLHEVPDSTPWVRKLKDEVLV